MMWLILVTIIIGGGVILLWKLLNYIHDKSYLYKKSYYRPVHYIVNNFRGCVLSVCRLLDRHPRAYRVVGMDCEMVSTSVNGGHPVPAILQLASPDGYCCVYQLKLIENAQRDKISVPFLSERRKIAQFNPPSENVIRQILEDPHILKVGVAVLNDARYLDESSGLFSKGLLDIRHLARPAGYEPRGLNDLALCVLGKEKKDINKKLRKPWESDTLNEEQICYAVEDARLSVEIFLKLNQIVIERKYYWLQRLFWSQEKYWKCTLKLWTDYIGKEFKFSPPSDIPEPENDWTEYIPKPLIRLLYRPEWRYAVFTPESVDSYKYCVVCGMPDDTSHIVRFKAMVPVDYSVAVEDKELYFINMCITCLEECRRRVDYELRLELTEECGAPYPDYKDDRLITAKKIAEQLICNENPSEVVGQEWQRLLEHSLHKMLRMLSPRHFHRSTMEIILTLDCWPESDHGKFVHEYFLLYGGLESLQWRWCEKFIKEMRPQHLPLTWMRFYREHPLWDQICW